MVTNNKSKNLLKRPSTFNLQPSAFSLPPGFTLLEVMISLAVVGGLLVTLLYTLNYHLGLADRHGVITASMNLAKDKMLDMEKSPRIDKGQFPEPYSNFSYETRVKDALIPGMAEIQVVVSIGKEETELSELVKKAVTSNK